MRRAFSLAVALIVMTLLSGCNPGPSFTTDLSLTRGLRKGDPVTHNGDKIGYRVNRVKVSIRGVDANGSVAAGGSGGLRSKGTPA